MVILSNAADTSSADKISSFILILLNKILVCNFIRVKNFCNTEKISISCVWQLKVVMRCLFVCFHNQ